MRPTWRQLLQPGIKLLTKITSKLFSSKSYTVPVTFQHCGPWYAYRNSIWDLESSVDPLWGSSVDPPCSLNKSKPPSSTRITCTEDVTTVEDSNELHCDTDKVSTLSILEHVNKAKQQYKSDTTLACEQDKATSSSSYKTDIQRIHLKPTTPSFFLSKSVHRHTTLKTIAEDEAADFSEEFSKPLPSLQPLSLIPRPRRQNGQEDKEWIKVVNPYFFKVPAISTTVDDPLANLNEGDSEVILSEDKNETVNIEKGLPGTHSTAELDEMHNAAQMTNTKSSITPSTDQNINHEEEDGKRIEATSAMELITPMDAPTSSTFPVMSEGGTKIQLCFDSEEKPEIINVTEVDEPRSVYNF